MGLSANQGLKIMADSLYGQARRESNPARARQLIADADRLMRQYYTNLRNAEKKRIEREKKNKIK